MIGPNAYFDTELINEQSRFCRELQDNIGAPFADLRAYDIGKRFCLVNRRLPPVGPYCQGNTCYTENNTALCAANNGEEAGSLMCALPPGDYRRAEGPLMWNGEILESSAQECSGLFCAIPEPNKGENLRCPTSAPLPDHPDYGKGPVGGPGPGPGAAVSTSQLVALLSSLLGLVVMLW